MDNLEKKKNLGLQSGLILGQTSQSFADIQRRQKRDPLGVGAGLHGYVCLRKQGPWGKEPARVCCLGRGGDELYK